jgi:YD repeat-containing protein
VSLITANRGRNNSDPLNDSGSVTNFSTTVSDVANQAWDFMCGVPSSGGTATANTGSTIRQQESGELYCADAGPEASGNSSIGWSTSGALHWLANYFSFAPSVSLTGGSGTTTFAYDNDGNLTSNGTSTYVYDYRNELTAVGNGHATSTYSYDFLGDRITTTNASGTEKV